MSNKFKDIDIKNLTYYFFNDIINIEHFDQNNIKIDEKLHENIFYLLYWICDNQKICKNLHCKSFVPYFQNFNGYF